MELKFKVILSSIITLSIAIATSFALTNYMVKNAKLEVTSNMNKTLLGEIQNTNQKIDIIKENMQKDIENLRKQVEKVKDKVPKEDSESLKNLLEVQFQEVHDAFSSINKQLQDLTNSANFNKDTNNNSDKEPPKDVNKEDVNKDSDKDTGKSAKSKFLGFNFF